MSEVKVNKVSPRSGTGLQLGDSGDTITVPSGAILTTTNATVNLPATTTVSTELKTNKISPASGTAFTLGDSGDTFTVPAGATITNSGTATGFGGGKILQVISVSKNDTFTTTSTSFVDVTGLTADITPASSSNKVLVTVLLGRLTTDDGGGFGAELNRGGSSIYDLAQGNLTDCFGTGGGGGMSDNDRKNDVSFIQYLDSPSSTSSLTYKIRVKRTSAGTGYINRWGLNDDQGAVSSITLMEVAV